MKTLFSNYQELAQHCYEASLTGLDELKATEEKLDRTIKETNAMCRKIVGPWLYTTLHNCGNKRCTSCPHGPYWVWKKTAQKTDKADEKDTLKTIHLGKRITVRGLRDKGVWIPKEALATLKEADKKLNELRDHLDDIKGWLRVCSWPPKIKEWSEIAPNS